MKIAKGAWHRKKKKKGKAPIGNAASLSEGKAIEGIRLLRKAVHSSSEDPFLESGTLLQAGGEKDGRIENDRGENE